MSDPSRDYPTPPPSTATEASSEIKELEEKALQEIKTELQIALSKGEPTLLTYLTAEEIQTIIDFLKKQYGDKKFQIIDADHLAEHRDLRNNFVIVNVDLDLGLDSDDDDLAYYGELNDEQKIHEQKIIEQGRQMGALRAFAQTVPEKDRCTVFQVLFTLPGTGMKDITPDIYDYHPCVNWTREINKRTVIEDLRSKK